MGAGVTGRNNLNKIKGQVTLFGGANVLQGFDSVTAPGALLTAATPSAISQHRRPSFAARLAFSEAS